MRQITVKGEEHRTPSEAVQHLSVSRHDVALSLGGRYFSVTRAEYERIEALGVQPTTWFDYHGRLTSVPGKC
jgi:hypothetical protein